jgi:predicted GNAT family N-acyltransferase
VAAHRRTHRADTSGRVLIRQVAAAAVRPLRHRVLRPGQGFDHTLYPGDDRSDTVHLGAFDGERLVGIASLYREPRPGGAGGGWRLRGMATEPDVRGAGFGAGLVAACIDRVATSGGGELWCNARIPAVGFYRRAGFEVVSDEFDVAGIGPHVVMALVVPGGTASG